MELQRALPAIRRLGARVVAASVDPLSESVSLARQLRLGYPILADGSAALGRAFGVFNLSGGMYMGPVDRHSIFIIGPTGHVLWRRLSLVQMSVPMPDVLAALERLGRAS